MEKGGGGWIDEGGRGREGRAETDRRSSGSSTKPKGERIIYISPLSLPLLPLFSLFLSPLPFFRLRIFRSELKSVSPPKTLSLSLSLGVVYLSERVAIKCSFVCATFANNERPLPPEPAYRFPPAPAPRLRPLSSARSFTPWRRNSD